MALVWRIYYYFIYSLHWGIRGAALAGNIGAGINLIVTFCFLLSSDSKLRLCIRDLKPDWALSREIFFVGYSSIIFSGLLTFVRLLVLFLPFVIALPIYYGVKGIFYAFPLADLLAFLLTGIFLYKEAARLNHPARETA